jgi:hypothetical protein
MSEIHKTVLFVVLALIAALAAYFVQPSRSFDRPEAVVGQALVEPFDPLSVTSMEIIKYDSQTGTAHPFKVEQAEVRGKPRWSIPSHDNYPADAKDQVAQAAASLMDLTILGVVSEEHGDEETFGVVDPEKPLAGAKGVGTRVTLGNKAGKVLISLIIGKEVKDRPGQRYVRLAGQPVIYTVAVKIDNLSTDFDRWIEKNLLNINPWDIHRLWLRDYSTALLMDMSGQVGVEKQNRGEMVLQYDDQGTPQWKLIESRVVNDDGTFSPVKMADDEELNVAKLNELKNALGDLKIVDVTPKPPGLSADLKAAADFTSRQESILTLLARGFVVANADDHVEVCSKEGEISCLMKDGVEYVLRFGDIALHGAAGASAKEEPKEEPATEQEPPDGLNRYLFVMAEFNPEAIEKPKLDSLPEPPPEEESKKDEKPQADASAGEDAASAAPAAESAPAEAEPAEKAAASPAETPPVDLKALQAERARIEKENQRKLDEYNGKIASGKKRVEELNRRFADWYYIISDAEYRKIHLSRDDVIKKKEKKEEKATEKSAENSLEQFKQLQEQGPGGR